jgi:hypothetical protein
MGCDVHITRAEHGTESAAAPITLDEWLDYVAHDTEMRLDNFGEAEVEGEILHYENVGLAVWTAYTGHGSKGNMAWFDFRRGSIVVKNPDAEILGKVRRIASALRSKAIGDDSELC